MDFIGDFGAEAIVTVFVADLGCVWAVDDELCEIEFAAEDFGCRGKGAEIGFDIVFEFGLLFGAELVGSACCLADVGELGDGACGRIGDAVDRCLCKKTALDL